MGEMTAAPIRLARSGARFVGDPGNPDPPGYPETRQNVYSRTLTSCPSRYLGAARSAREVGSLPVGEKLLGSQR